MARLPDAEATLATLRAIGSAPTAPYHEHRALAAVRGVLTHDGIELREDAHRQLFASVRRGSPRRPIALVAHTDHPAFEVVSAYGHEGIARVLGGFRGRVLEDATGVLVHADDAAVPPVRGIVDRFVPDLDPIHNSPGRMRIRAERDLVVGEWATLDLPACDLDGDDLRMVAADDLAGCAIVADVLLELAASDVPVDVTGVFTRAEETGLYGARIVAEDDAIARDAIVISVEASRALPHAAPGNGIVVRSGDLNNTFSNEAERFLRAAAERLRRDGIPTQRALLDGGTCEASTFVVHGWDTTAIALPNVNYHDRGPDDRFAPEVVRLSDVRGGIALLVETARAIAEDAREAWWTTAGPVPEQVREVLRNERRS
ncbi:MAG: M28 family peptidase [Chloroflexota bacterium]|nr:M28 family peptidase [Chloroflexota bacterium]